MGWYELQLCVCYKLHSSHRYILLEKINVVGSLIDTDLTSLADLLLSSAEATLTAILCQENFSEIYFSAFLDWQGMPLVSLQIFAPEARRNVAGGGAKHNHRSLPVRRPRPVRGAGPELHSERFWSGVPTGTPSRGCCQPVVTLTLHHRLVSARPCRDEKKMQDLCRYQ
jgi:hypothetical protein